MLELKGKYTTAKIYAEKVEEGVISQVKELLNHPMFKDEHIRVMADTHAGKGCVIGLTSTNKNKVIIPNIIGVDIGCAMLSINLGNIDIDLRELDDFITNEIPSGFNTNKIFRGEYLSKDFLNEVKRISNTTKSDYNRHLLSLGSLGGGNHFHELALDKHKNKWLIIHSGSRNFGLQVAKYHQKIAEEYCKNMVKDLGSEKNKTIEVWKQDNKNLSSNEFQQYISSMAESISKYKVSKDLSFLENKLADDYIEDMEVATKFAHHSRKIMADRIIKFLNAKPITEFETMHNYYDGEIIRKGAVSAKLGEKILIPINMKDGSILAIGKGDVEYNNSAPHGAGRLMSRTKAKKELNMKDFKESMEGVFTTSVTDSTLDEAPLSYKPIEEILNNINDTVEVLDILKPIYNFKAH